MTETERIRWTDSRNSPGDPAFAGHVGDLYALFRVWPPEDPGDEWLLTAVLPGKEGERLYGFPVDLKAEAERWLEEFVASLGAVFGDAVAADLRSRADDLEAMVCREPGQEHDNLLFSAGLKRAADLIEHGDQPAVTPATPAPMAGEKESKP